MRQDQNIKGFTILELLVVITIVAIVSAVGYPNFMDWREDREIRAATEKVSTMITNINAQLQRGNFQYVQLQINPKGTTETNFYSKGMYQDTFSDIISNSNKNLDCRMVNSGYWDEHKVEETTKSVSVHIDGDGSVCFSKDGSKFKTSGKLDSNINLNINGEAKDDYVIICTTSNAKKTGGKCGVNKASKLEKPAYLVLWSRFGTVKKYKWNGSDWTIQ